MSSRVVPKFLQPSKRTTTGSAVALLLGGMSAVAALAMQISSGLQPVTVKFGFSVSEISSVAIRHIEENSPTGSAYTHLKPIQIQRRKVQAPRNLEPVYVMNSELVEEMNRSLASESELESVPAVSGVLKEAEPVLEYESEEDVVIQLLDSQALSQLLKDAYSAPVVKIKPRAKAKVNVTKVDIQSSDDFDIAAESIPAIQKVRWDEDYGVVKLGYSDLLAHFTEKDSATATDAKLSPALNIPLSTHDDPNLDSTNGLRDLIAAIPEQAIHTPQAALSIQPQVVTASNDYSPIVVTLPMGTIGPSTPAVTMVSPIDEVGKEVATQNQAPTPAPEMDSHSSEMKVETTGLYSGTILEAFALKPTPVNGATVQILGTEWTAMTDESGAFRFENVKLDNDLLPVVITKEGYLQRRVELRSTETAQISLVAENTALMSATLVGVNVSTSAGSVFGQLTNPEGGSVSGLTVEVTAQSEYEQSIPAYYGDEMSVLHSELRETSESGAFAFFNLAPGTYVMTVLDSKRQERAPHLIHISANEGLAKDFSLGLPTTLVGKVFNSAHTNALVDDAKIQVFGLSARTTSDVKGSFSLGPIYLDCSETIYLQMLKDGFYRNRFSMTCDSSLSQQAAIPLYAFSKANVDGASVDARVPLEDQSKGVIMGHISGQGSAAGRKSPSVKVQLWGPNETTPMDQAEPRGKDFYYDTDGILKGALNRTTDIGNFAIFEAPQGLSYVQTFDSTGKTLGYRPLIVGPGTVSVHLQ